MSAPLCRAMQADGAACFNHFARAGAHLQLAIKDLG